MKKFNFIIRLFLYSLPLIYVIYCAFVFSKTGNNTAIDLYDALITGLIGWCSNNSYFSSFYTWFNNNISFGYVYINLAFASCCYFIMVEFIILFKNVLMYLFNVANVWLEKGVTNGK